MILLKMLQRHLLALNATNYCGATKYGHQQNPRNVSTTLLFLVLTENDSFRSCIQHIRLPPSCANQCKLYILEQISIDNPLTFNICLLQLIFHTSVFTKYIMYAKVFSIQIFPILPRVVHFGAFYLECMCLTC